MTSTWKKRTLHASMLAILTTVALGAVSASAADTTSTSIAKPNKVFHVVKGEGVKGEFTAAAPALHVRSTFGGLLRQPALERNYLKLLASTYSPDTLADWTKALDERKQAEADMPKPTFDKRVILKDGENVKIEGDGQVDKMFFSKDGSSAPADIKFFSRDGSAESVEGLPPLEELPDLPELTPVQDGEGKTGPKRIIIQHSAPLDGTAPKGVTKVLPVEPGAAGDIMIAAPALPESFKLQEKLVEAVEADNAEGIRTVLADLLKEYVKQTDELREMAKKIQEKLPTETEKENK
ncbi:hypothetical protein [Paenibacillus roseipurpureus]|uniref:Uncharacterized protein n=1 Tax=Paenibacillus roseopurpureus TaxID=2918901 RepID=A0AA96LQS4_9BACL|nr:hypothetical protein [Paenibacillus sp. MBLB1832]WNR44113.1 hypothetical protein MJB10_23930 [Paenibacillus sp. MBLB1832]